jgi:hypothetical protein
LCCWVEGLPEQLRSYREATLLGRYETSHIYLHSILDAIQQYETIDFDVF